MITLLVTFGWTLTAHATGIAVTPDAPGPGRWTISSSAYQMVLNLESPRVESFDASGFTLIPAGVGLAPTINTGAPWGPAKARTVLATPEFTCVVLHGMRWEEQLTGDIEVHFFCFPDRVVVRFDIVPRATAPALLLGWVGAVKQAAPFPIGERGPDWRTVFAKDGPLDAAAVLVPPLLKGSEGRRGAHVRIDHGQTLNAHYVFNSHDIGTRSTSATLLAAHDEASLLNLLGDEWAARRLPFEATNGRFVGYDTLSGLHRFVMKPDVDAMEIQVPSASDAGIRSVMVGVFALKPSTAIVEGGDGALESHWVPRDFRDSGANGPGMHVFRLDLGLEPKTVRLRRTDAVDHAS